MATRMTTSNDELRHFQKLIGLLKKTPAWNKHSEHTKVTNDLCTNTSKEAQDVRDIMWRMVGAELHAAKKLKQDS
jgi:hypothetical protein